MKAGDVGDLTGFFIITTIILTCGVFILLWWIMKYSAIGLAKLLMLPCTPYCGDVPKEVIVVEPPKKEQPKIPLVDALANLHVAIMEYDKAQEKAKK